MRKGGYKIVDFKGAELTSTVIVRPGIYSYIIDNYDKPILVSGASIGGSVKDDSFASVNEITGESGDSVELGVYSGVITVTEDDEISFVQSKSNAELAEEIEELNDKVDAKIFYKNNTYTTSTSIAMGQAKGVEFDVSLNGYRPIGILSITKSGSNQGFVAITSYYIDNNTAKLVFVNTFNAEIILTNVNVNVLYEKA